MNILYRMLISFYLPMPMLVYYMNDTIHATPVHPSLCLQYFNPVVYYDHRYCCFHSTVVVLYYCHCYKTVATDKLLQASLFPGAADLKNHPSKLIFILWLPLCRINKLGYTTLEDCCHPLYLWVINCLEHRRNIMKW